MEIYKNPISLFKQTNFSKTIWWQLKVNISGYQNETEDKLVTETVSYTHLTLPTTPYV